jgi:hypothetical protein
VSHRYAARVDPGQAAIVEALRSAGALIGFWGTAGAADLVCAYRGRVFLLEVKEPLGPAGGSSRRGQHLTPAQERWHQRWRAYVTIVRSVEDALEAVGLRAITDSRVSVARAADDRLS